MPLEEILPALNRLTISGDLTETHIRNFIEAIRVDHPFLSVLSSMALVARHQTRERALALSKKPNPEKVADEIVKDLRHDWFFDCFEATQGDE